VFRRYSEFLRLKALAERLDPALAASPGWKALPPLPPRRLLGRTSKRFLRGRRRALEAWIRAVVALPAARACEVVARFLTYRADVPPARMSAPVVELPGHGGARAERETARAGSPAPARGGSPASPPDASGNSKFACSPAAPGPDAAEPTALSDFILVKMLGVGAYGRVILVQHARTLRPYAMKVVSKTQVREENQVPVVNRERRLLAMVRHPFICTLHHAFQTRHKLYLVLDYCPGGELLAVIGRRKKLSERRTRFYAAELVSAVAYLHSLGIVYRDLKPENVLLDCEGHVQLVDFGLSKDGVLRAAGCTHSFCGTPEYLAPEIVMGQAHGRAVDWWSLGMLAYEMMTGLPPWYTSDRFQLFSSICEARVEFPWTMSSDARSLVQGLLQRRPADRLGSRGADAVRGHAFFRPVDWRALDAREVAPPFRPRLGTRGGPKNPGTPERALAKKSRVEREGRADGLRPRADGALDASYFDPEVTRKPISAHFEELGEEDDACSTPELFAGFTFTREGSVTDGLKGGGRGRGRSV
jgi:serine/threonine protein kinase